MNYNHQPSWLLAQCSVSSSCTSTTKPLHHMTCILQAAGEIWTDNLPDGSWTFSPADSDILTFMSAHVEDGNCIKVTRRWHFSLRNQIHCRWGATQDQNFSSISHFTTSDSLQTVWKHLNRCSVVKPLSSWKIKSFPFTDLVRSLQIKLGVTQKDSCALLHLMSD